MPQIHTLADFQEVNKGQAFEDSLVAFIHAGEQDGAAPGPGVMLFSVRSY